MGKVSKKRNRREKKEMLSQLKKDDVKVVGFDEMTREEVIEHFFKDTTLTSGIEKSGGSWKDSGFSKIKVHEWLKEMNYTNETHVIVLMDKREWSGDVKVFNEKIDEVIPDSENREVYTFNLPVWEEVEMRKLTREVMDFVNPEEE